MVPPQLQQGAALAVFHVCWELRKVSRILLAVRARSDRKILLDQGARDHKMCISSIRSLSH